MPEIINDYIELVCKSFLNLSSKTLGAGVGKSNFVSFGFEDYSLGAGFNFGSNPETGSSANTWNLSGSAHGVGLNLGITDIANHDNLVSLGANYGMFSGGTSFQGGELKDVSGTVGLWNGSKSINPTDWTCFVAGTPVTLADGSTKAIETLKKGDKVLSWNEKTNKNEARTVLNAFRKETKQIVELKLKNGKFIETTPDHPFYVQSKGWVEAGKLNINDKLFDKGHSELAIESLKIVDRVVPVYNLEVEGNHTYYAHGVLVHNKNCWVTTKDGQSLLVNDKQYAQLIKDGKDPSFQGTEDGKPSPNNPNNPINQAFEAAEEGRLVDFDYTPEQFVEFVQSEDGFKAMQNNEHMKNVISDHFKALIVGAAAGIVISESVAMFKNAVTGGSLHTAKFPENPGQVGHIFQPKHGIVDTPSTRADLQNLVNRRNYLGPDSNGNSWYSRMNSDGSQTWVRTRNGTINNAGINPSNEVRTYNPKTGL
ncbi:MAG: Hint domain-containing protein [Candidatus Caenarcaniphilales bacterium]|nr:Hint domain-containing protein [Candidatus Caenarcaniphilales bacterium]